MKFKRLAAVLGVLALVTVVGAFAAVTAFAQTSTPEAQSTPAAPDAQSEGRLHFERGFGLFGGDWTVFDAQAEALNLTPTELFEQLHSGKTLSEIAEAQGVDLQTVQDAAEAAETQAMRDRINQAVEDGTMTQAQADWLLQGLEQGYLPGGPGFGPMGGRGPRGGMFRFDNGIPAAPATPETGTES